MGNCQICKKLAQKEDVQIPEEHNMAVSPEYASKTLLEVLHDYNCGTKNTDLTAVQGDVVFLEEGCEDTSDWCLVSKGDNQGNVNKGYVPSVYLVKKGSWKKNVFLYRQTAEKLLLSPLNNHGSFVVWQADILTTLLFVRCHEEEKQQVSIKKYKIRTDTELNMVYITSRAKFNTIEELIDFYKEQTDGMCNLLISPAIVPQVNPPQLSHDLIESHRVRADSFQLFEKIGSGTMTDTFKGSWNKCVDVAVKMFKPDTIHPHILEEKCKLLHRVNHTNIVKWYAVSVDTDTKYILMEYMPGGSLLDYLSSESQNIKQLELVYFASQIADGMECLEQLCITHESLAAGNILLDKNRFAKISDVGLYTLAKDFKNIGEYEMTLLNKYLRHLAPEVIKYNQHSTKSDVWSYGVVLQELFTLGTKPFLDMSDQQFKDMIMNEKQAITPLKPNLCPDKIFRIMTDCFHREKNSRPSFTNLQIQVQDYYVNLACVTIST